MKMKFTFPKLNSFFLNILSVVIGVLLAFSINEWGQEVQYRKKRIQALETIAGELKENHARIVYTYDYFSSIVRQLDSIKTNYPETYENLSLETGMIKGWRGATPPPIRSHSYNMIVETGMAGHLLFKENNVLAYIYNIQAMVEKLNEALMQKVMSDREIYSIAYIHRYFQLYLEILPSVMAAYQFEGREILGKFGYDQDVESKALDESIKRQIKLWKF